MLSPLSTSLPQLSKFLWSHDCEDDIILILALLTTRPLDVKSTHHSTWAPSTPASGDRKAWGEKGRYSEDLSFRREVQLEGE